jgi:hypothetical protein
MAIDLGRQIGPLPLGAWIAVVGGGLGLAYYSYTNSAPAASDADTAAQDAVNGIGNGAVGGWVQTQPTDPATTVTIETNEQWARQAINWLIAQGYDASESDSAIRKYIAGNDPAPSIKEYVLQGFALAKFGSPPNPLPPPLTPPPTVPPPVAPPPPTPPPPPPPPSPPPAPANVRWFTVKPWPQKGSSLWTIAEIYYGNGSQYPRIFNANKTGVRRPDGSMGMISNPNLIRPGWVLHIP